MSLEDTGAAPEAVPATPAPPADAKPAAEAAPPVEYKNEAEAEAALDAELRETYRKSTATEAETPGRERDEAGRFVGKSPATDGDKSPPPGEKAGDKTQVADKATEKISAPGEKIAAEIKPAVEAPRAWAADMKGHWAKVPGELHKYISDREGELNDAKSRLGRAESIAKPMQGVLAKHEAYLKAAAADRPLEFVDHIIEAAHKLDRDPDAAFAELAANMAPRFKDRDAFVKSIARNLGVDLGRLYDPLEAPPDARVLQLEQENRQWRQYHESQERQRAAQAQQAEAARTGETLSVIDKFVASKPDVFNPSDKDGIERVMVELSPFVHAIRARNPQLDADAVLAQSWTAYERTQPASFDKLVAAEADKKLKERDAAAAEAAAKARAAMGVNVRSVPRSNAADSDDDEDNRLRAIYRRNRAQ